MTVAFAPVGLVNRLYPTYSVSANTASPGAIIPADFIGLSYEAGSHGLLGGFFSGSASSLRGMVGLLGTSGVIRIGGNTSDSIPAPALTQQIANDLKAFCDLLGNGWTIIYGLDAVANDSSLAAIQAGYLVNAFGASKVVFQVANEPIDGSSPNFTNASYATRFNDYYNAVTTAIPTAKFAAFDDANFGQTSDVLSRITPATSALAWITQHYYPWEAITPPGAESLVLAHPTGHNESLVSVGVGSTVATMLVKNSGIASGASVTQRMTESSLVSSGGTDGVSNTLMAATWLLGFQIQMIAAGWGGINIHGGLTSPPGHYDPIYRGADGVCTPGPIFYALYLFSMLAGHQVLPTTLVAGTDIAAISTLDGSNVVRMLIVNGLPKTIARVKPSLSSAWTSATVLKLAGNSCLDRAPTLGGAVIGAGGSWNGATESIVSGQSVDVSPCGAALLTFT